MILDEKQINFFARDFKAYFSNIKILDVLLTAA